jgi:carbamoyl-phosphate synthase large subunit
MSPRNHSNWPRTLITGAGGPAAIAVIRSLLAAGVPVAVADADPTATGLFMVPAEQRYVIPHADRGDFVESLLDACLDSGSGALLPTVDAELLPLARERSRFAAQDIATLVGAESALRAALDKEALGRLRPEGVAMPRTVPLRHDTLDAVAYPAIAKPRRGSGGRGVRRVEAAADALELAGSPNGEDMILQELLPGAEYTVDVLVRQDGLLVAAVPRERLRIDSGVAVAARIVRDAELERAAASVMRALGLVGLCNVQLKVSRAGRPALLEVNPRPAGTLPLTVAAGVDMPVLAVADAVGEPVAPVEDYDEIAIVRYLEDIVIPAADISPPPLEAVVA